MWRSMGEHPLRSTYGVLTTAGTVTVVLAGTRPPNNSLYWWGGPLPILPIDIERAMEALRNGITKHDAHSSEGRGNV